jgi:pilus assembly protein CpaB
MRRTRGIFLFFLAAVLGLGAAWMANNWLGQRLNLDAEASLTTPIVVAALEIPFGQKIEPVHLKTVQMAPGTFPSGVFHEHAEVTGRIAMQPIYRGEPILDRRVAEHLGGSVLATLVEPEMRAITVRVNDVIGVAGFLLPGNRVDVLATRREGRNRAEARTLLQDLKVLAVDQTSAPNKNDPVIVRAVTLEMTPRQAEILVRAQTEGSVQLTLRNPLDQSVVAEPEEEKPAAPVVRRGPGGSSVTVIRGTRVDSTRVRL